MDKKITLKTNTIVLFFLNIFILISLVVFRKIFSEIGYVDLWVNMMFIFDIIILAIGLFFNIKLVTKPNNNIKKSIIVMVICFALYLLVNIVGFYVVNKLVVKKYSAISDRLLGYCEKYECEKYQTKKENEYFDFIIENTYYDYNNVKLNYEIHNLYDTKKVSSVTAIIYSDNDSFSQELIKKLVYDYFLNFNVQLNSDKIKEAFDKRLDNSIISDENLLYSVTEIYKKEKLTLLKTVIKLKMTN